MIHPQLNSMWLEPPAGERTSFALRYRNKAGKKERIRLGDNEANARAMYQAIRDGLALPEVLAEVSRLQNELAEKVALLSAIVARSSTVGCK